VEGGQYAGLSATDVPGEAVDRITVVKIGGSTLGNHDTTLDDIVSLQRQGKPVVVVHGGGKLITEWLTRLGVTSKFVRGERVTDQATLEVVVAVLAGVVNKDLVTAIGSRGGRAVGIAGVDGSLIEGTIGDSAKGYVGVVTRVNTGVMTALMNAGYVPIVAPVGLNGGERPDGTPAALNFNADTVAGDIAAAVSADRLIFLTDVPGILDRSNQLIPDLSVAEARTLLDTGVASGGMIPKIQACLRALSAVEAACIVDGREPHALMHTLGPGYPGTTIHR
jgi:acetylglutamate kinase